MAPCGGSAGGAGDNGAADDGADEVNGGSRPGVAARARSWGASAGGGSGRSAPPLNLPSRDGSASPPGRNGNGNGAAAGHGAAAAHRAATGSAAGADRPACAPGRPPVAPPARRPEAGPRCARSRLAARRHGGGRWHPGPLP